ncbi:MAG: ABC transporter permease [Microbacteriaceae bacterium]|nr:ABC transporter permease [Microbacteriaceae bacterium]
MSTAQPAGTTETLAESIVRGAARSRRWGSWYVAEHKIAGLRGYFWTLVATAIGTPFLYLFAFGIGLATLITENVGPVPGITYLEFVAPALLASAAVLVAMEEYTFGILQGLKWNTIFFGMNATPITGRQIVNGVMIFVGIRMTMTTAIYFVIMLAFGAVPSASGVLIIVAGMLAGFAFSPVAAYAATITEDRGQFAILQRIVILPLTLFSGTVFPLTQLPIFLQWIGWLSPLWHASELGRQFSYGPTEPIWLTIVHVAYPLALGVFGWQLCVWFVTRRLNK